MKNKLTILMLSLLMAMPMMAQFTSAPAFPGAEGYGRYTTGGRGDAQNAPTVYHVTRLDDYIQDKDYSPNYTADAAIPGTLRYAVTRSGARIVVFDVAGTIELKCPLKIKNGDITILGQTAPGDGITLKNYTLGIDANNVIVRYIRCRMGDEGKRYYKEGNALTDTAFEDDAMNAYHKSGSECNNIIIDHCSISWCVDECGSFYGNNNFTLQWCVLSESLRNSVHEKGKHGYGGIWGGSNASFHHNLLAHHDSRMIRFDHDYVSTCKGPVDYINNVVYNWGNNSTYGGESSDGNYKMINMVNNYYKPGHATSNGVKTRLLNPTTKCDNCTSTSKTPTSKGTITPGHFYLSGNYMYGSTEVTNDNTCEAAIDPDNNVSYNTWKSTYLSNSRFTSSAENNLNMHSAENAFNNVVSYAGASYCRDAVDTRIADETRNGTYTYTGSNGSTGGLIDSPSDVGGYPTLTGTKATDSDNDGIPDAWEEAHGLDKSNASDALTYTLDNRKYYTNLEVYANYLVQHITKAERAGATETFVEYYPLEDGEAPKSNDASATFTLDGSSVVFSNNSYTKTIEADDSKQSFPVVITPATGASVTSKTNATGSGNDYAITAPSAGNSVTATFTITAEDGTTTKTYTITINKNAIPDPVDTTEGNFTLRFTSDDAGDVTITKTYCEFFTIVGTSNKRVTIDSSKKEIGNVSFTHCAKMGGTGSSTSLYISFPVAGPCMIKVYGASANSSETRSLTIASGSEAIGTPLKTDFCLSSTDPICKTYNYTGDATTIYIYSTNSGYNIYGIDVTQVVNLSEDNNYTTFDAGKYHKVTLKRTFTGGKWETLVVPFDISTEKLISAFGNDSEAANVTSITNNKLYFKTTASVKANTPLLFMVAENGVAGDNTYTFEDITIINADDATAQSADGKATWHGVYATTGYNAIPETAHIITGSTMYDWSYINTVRPFRAYIDVPSAAGAKLSLAIEDDVVTEIRDVNTLGNGNAVTYNLNGQRVNTNVRGINIRNGKKVIIK